MKIFNRNHHHSNDKSHRHSTKKNNTGRDKQHQSKKNKKGSNMNNSNSNSSQTSGGSSKNVIDQLMHLRLRATYENMESCLICSNKHNIGDVVTILPCGHMYHSNCASIWLQQCCSCPICRHDLSFSVDDDDTSSNRHDSTSEQFLHQPTMIMNGYSEDFIRTEPQEHDRLSLVARVLRLQHEEENIQ